MSSSKCCPSRSIGSFISTPVNCDTTLKLTIVLWGPTWRESKVTKKSAEFITWSGELPVWVPSSPARYLAKQYVGPNGVHNWPQWNNLLMDLQQAIESWGPGALQP
jgi:hypothetical protein